LRKEVRKMKEEWKTRVKGLEKGMDTMEKERKEVERTIIDRHKEEEEERVARITNLLIELIDSTETVKGQQEEEKEREETKKEINILKRMMDRKMRERKN